MSIFLYTLFSSLTENKYPVSLKTNDLKWNNFVICTEILEVYSSKSSDFLGFSFYNK